MLIDWIQPLLPPEIYLAVISVFVILVFVVVAFFREWGTPDIVALSALAAVLLAPARRPAPPA